MPETTPGTAAQTPQPLSAGSPSIKSLSIKSLSIIGAGAWGTALAAQACRAGRVTRLYARRPEHAAILREQRENRRYLPSIDLPPELLIDGDLATSLAADAVLYAQPAQYFRDFCRGAKAHLDGTTALVICAKGIELGTGRLLTEIAAEELPGQPVAVLSGPSFATEAALGMPTAVAIATQVPGLAENLMTALSHAAFRPYGSTDPIGVEVAGATKNVLAIACGIVIGRGLGENARAALITRGLAEVMKAGAPHLSLLTTELAGAGCAPVDGVRFHVDAAPEPAAPVSVEQQQDEAVGEFDDPPSTGIHAKLLAVSKGSRTALMLGSANLTGRGLTGPNAEAVAILDITDPALADSLYGFVNSGIDLAAVEVDTTEEREKERAERELDDLISQFLEVGFSLSYREDGLHLLIGDGGDEALRLARFEVSPFLDPEAWSAIEPGARSILLLANAPTTSERRSSCASTPST